MRKLLIALLGLICAPAYATNYNKAGLTGAIDSTIRANGVQAITGPVLQGQLQNFIDSMVGYRGNYNSATTYLPGEMVLYQGSSFVAMGTTLGNSPYSGSVFWQALGTASGVWAQALTPLATNTFPTLANAYSTGTVGNATIFVNGVAYNDHDSNPAFSITASSVTWNAANAGFSIQPSNRVSIVYTGATGAGNTATIPPNFVTAGMLASGTAAANLGAAIGTSGATIPLNNGANVESGQWQWGALLGTSDTLSPIMSGINQTTYLPNGTLGPIFGQLVESFTGGAANDAAATVQGATRGHNVINSGVTYLVGTGGQFQVDNYSWLAQGVSVTGQCNSWHGGRCWGGVNETWEEAESFTATASQTVFPVVNSFVQGGSVIYKNGSGTPLVLGTAYTETGCSASLCTGFTLATGATAGDTFQFWRGVPQLGNTPVETDLGIGPGLDTLNATTGNRIGSALVVRRTSATANVPHHAGSGYLITTSGDSNVTVDRAYPMVGQFGCGLCGDQATFTGPLVKGASGQFIGIGDYSGTFPLTVAGNSTSYPNGELARLYDSGDASDFRVGYGNFYHVGEIGTFSNHDMTIWRNSAIAMRFYATYASLVEPLQITPGTIAALATCSSTTVATQAWVNNGISAPTYHQAVSTTGSATWPVYCTYNGSSYSWVY